MPPQFRPGLILVRDIVGLSPLRHFGVWVDEDEVIHAQKGPPTTAAIISTTFEVFAQGLGVSPSDLYNRLVIDPATTIERARSAVGPWPYHYRKKNCEAFAYWCATGREWQGMQAALAETAGNVLHLALGGKPSKKSSSKPVDTDLARRKLDERFRARTEQLKADLTRKSKQTIAEARGISKQALANAQKQKKPD